jgi:hypothetical protein
MEEGDIEKKYKEWEEVEKDGRSYWITLRKQKIIEGERGSSRSHTLEKSLWKNFWICHKTD